MLSLILAQWHTFLEIDHEIFSMVILLLLFQERLMSVTSESMCAKYCMVKPPSQACPEKSVIRLNDHLYMTIAVDWDVKPQTKQND